MEGDTAALRKAAPNWSLAGDKQLLELLQKMHKKIMNKCEEANTKLDAMVDALDNASIDLQNVNNRFMALSNSQFVESRVYDDHVDIITNADSKKVEPQKVEAESEMVKMKRSLQQLEEMHEPVHILDSDSSDDEDDGSIILKPKERYARRPLPYIIGSQAWKTKWHVGLLAEDSDSDSSVSKRDNIPAEEYSESEPETMPTDQIAQRTISSSSMESEMVKTIPITVSDTRQPSKPADIAAELARRLGGQPVQVPTRQPVVIDTPGPTATKVYKVEKPAPTTVFSDEPPPLDEYQSEKSDYSEDDDDIFAELHKKPYPKNNRVESTVAKDLFGNLKNDIADDLFGGKEKDGDIGNIVDEKDVKSNFSNGEKSPLFDDSEVAPKPIIKPKPQEIRAENEGAIKKPVGGVSLFGSNKEAESIGAAILKRNQRRSTSDEDSDIPEITQNLPEETRVKEEAASIKEKTIKELFNKPAKNITKAKEETHVKREPEIVESVKSKIDLFSDNLFDDIDDIFTTNNVTKSKENKILKSIFDDDDLFADIAVKKPEKTIDKTSIFSSDDDLFTENSNSPKNVRKQSSFPINVEKSIGNHENMVKVNEVNSKKNKSIFDEDSDDDLFSDIKTINKNKNYHQILEDNNIITAHTSDQDTKRKVCDDSKLFIDNNIKSDNIAPLPASTNLSNEKTSKHKLQSPSIFDDEEVEDLFCNKDKSMESDANISNNLLESNCKKASGETKEIKRLDFLQVCDSNLETIASEVEQNSKLSNVYSKNIDEVIISNKPKSAAQSMNLEFKSSQSIEVISEDMHDIKIKSQHQQNKESSLLTGVSSTLSNVLTTEEYDAIDPADKFISKQTVSDLKETEILSDIFNDLPPVFEKPVEPKKSKNINALFDDDSEDEALFFKKNDGISDEKPDVNYDSDRFRIFQDEPPDIDIDFSQKPLRNIQKEKSEVPKDCSQLQNHELSLKQEDNIEIAQELTQSQNENKDVDTKDTVDKMSRQKDKKQEQINISKLLEEMRDENSAKDKNCDFQSNRNKSNLLENIIDTSEGSKTEASSNKEIVDAAARIEQNKSVGKLKPANININVNTLLPGASLKKTKTHEETDGQTISTKSNEELSMSPEKIPTKMIKSVSFDGDPESKVLDNKLSKERAKIQVKRRPSSRKARLEAVRKSGIDFGSDSTDNSSSFDEPPSKNSVITKFIPKDEIDSTIYSQNKLTKDRITENKNNYDINLHKDPNKNDADISTPSPVTTELHKKSVANVLDNTSVKTEVKSKIVYILHDEDIFNDVNIKKDENSEKEKNKKDIGALEDDDEYLFKPHSISTLGKSYEQSGNQSNVSKKEDKTIEVKKGNSLKPKKSLFDDLSDDDELFTNKNPGPQKAIIFNSDSEGELFAKSKKEDKLTSNELKREVAKGSLFVNDSDDDDLFGLKASKNTYAAKQRLAPTEVSQKVSQPVFEDPLSKLDDET